MGAFVYYKAHTAGDVSADRSPAVVPKSSPPSPAASTPLFVPRNELPAPGDTLAPIEADAHFSNLGGKWTVDRVNALVELIRMDTYKCDSLSSVRSLMTSRGYEVTCNSYSYDYLIEDKGGHIRVTVK
jgi:hypothetical protein